MSSPSSSLTEARSAPSPRTVASSRIPLTGWLREPLLHFVILGALLFAVDRYVVGRSDDPRVIVVGRDVDDEARRLFTASRGRAPDAEELRALRQVWLDNEVLYREGLALQVDKGDSAIRERVIFKALSVVDASVQLPPVDDTVLRDWFEAHRAKYDEPPRFDFEEAVLSGDNPEAAVRAFAETLNGGTPGDAKAGLRVFKGRPESNLASAYGSPFVAALERSRPGVWQALPTTGGWRAVVLDAKTPGRPAVYETLRGVVRQDWADATLAEQRSAAVRVLARKYEVRNEAAAR